MANFDTGLLGFSPDDEEKYREYMIRSLRPDMYDRTQQVGGVNLDWLNQMQGSAPKAPEQPIGQPAEAEKPQAPQQQPVQGLLGKTPEAPQTVEQEKPEVTQQVNPIDNQAQGTQQAKAETLASGGGASSGAAEMAQSSEAANADAAAAGKSLEAKKENMMEETSQQSQQQHQQKLQEAQGFDEFLGGLLGMGLNSLIPGSFFLKKAGIMHK
jgi:hypothetical protein